MVIRTPAVEPAFREALLTARTTFNVFVYAKNDAAENQPLLLTGGLPNLASNSFSELTVTTSLAGPHLNSPAKPPIDAPTAGTTEVKSFSVTCTPGDS